MRGQIRGTERAPNGTLRYFYQYKVGGAKHYYEKVDKQRMWLPSPKQYIPRRADTPRYEDEYFVPRPPVSNLETMYNGMEPNVRKLISTWLLTMGFANINLITPEEVSKSFRKLSLIHHPDRGGSEDNYKQLASVRDHLMTLCKMASVL